MKYRSLNEDYELINEEDLLNKLLKDRGVENPNEFLNIDDSVIHDGKLLRNMDRGLNMLHWHIENNSKIHIINDVDVDGISSGVEINSYIRDVSKNLKITHSMNGNKIHGIVLKNLEEYDFDLLIVPDAGSSDIEQCKSLMEDRDVDILIIDHHEIPRENPYAIVINCQDCEYPNNTLSGSGMVYKFIKEYDKKYNYSYADKYLDLAALGIVADSMDLRNYETRYLAMLGLKNINNRFLEEFLIKNKIEDKGINFEFVGWKVAPFINATTRIGSEEERRDLVDAFLGVDDQREYQPRRKHKDDPKPPKKMQTLQQYTMRKINSIKAKQDKQVAEGMRQIIEIIEDKKLTFNKIIIVDGTDIIDKSYTGLVANKLADVYKRPVIILKKMKEIKGEFLYGGSFRNYHLFAVPSLSAALKELNTFEMLAGHANAGGVRIRQSKIQETVDKFNNKLKDVDIEDIYLVDYEIPVGRLKEKHILQVGKWANIWGNTLKKPMFAITNISLGIEDIKLLGDKRNFIRIEKNIGKNKIVFVKKFANEATYNKMIMKHSKGLMKKSTNRIKMDVIGEFVINEWNGHEFAQIEIIDFNVSSAKDIGF